MKISEVLRNKGSDAVVTMRPEDSVSRLLDLLAEHRIGAVVVSADGASLDGIVTERDIVRALHERGATLLDQAVSAIMTTDVHTCTRDTDLTEVADTMTQRRIRHLPVVAGDDLRSLVSIGDIVKARIDQLQDERDQLVDYIQQ